MYSKCDLEGLVTPHRTPKVLLASLHIQKSRNTYSLGPVEREMTEESPRQRAYLIARPIFSGSNAQLRRAKPVREIMLSHKLVLSRLLDDHGEQDLVAILQGLLKDRIFESELQAKAEFPSLFGPAGQRDLEREESEIDAARSTQDAIEKIESGDECEPEAVDVGLDTVGDQKSSFVGDAQFVLPSLYPCYIPYGTQHRILTTVQNILEVCCFDFAKQWLPKVLEKRGWDCPSAVELTKWANVLGKHSQKLPLEAFDDRGTPIKKLLLNNHTLRHTAVHRVPTTARGISLLIQNALELVEALQDHKRAAQLDNLKCELDSKIKAMELNKNVLENSTSNQLEDIRRAREVLARREQELLDHMVNEDMRNRLLVGTLLEQSVDAISVHPTGPKLETRKLDEVTDDSGTDDVDQVLLENTLDRKEKINGSGADAEN